MSAHTLEPWRAESGGTDTWWAIVTAAGEVIVDLADSSFSVEQDRANAKRIVACVNACAGIADPAATLDEVRRLLTEAVNSKRSKVTMEKTFAALALLWPK